MDNGIDITSLEFSQNPYKYYDSLRESGNIHYLAKNKIWLVIGYQEIIDILLDTDTFSSEGENSFDPILLNCDPPKHTLHKKLLKGNNGLFAQQRIQSIECTNRQISKELLDSLRGKDNMDLLSDYSQKFAALVILKHLGINEVDNSFLDFTYQSVSTKSIHNKDFAENTWIKIKPLLDRWVQAAQDQPHQKGIAEIIHHKDSPHYFKKDDLVHLTKVLLVGGNETTPNLISSVLYFLLKNKEVKDISLNDSDILNQVIHEILRLESPTQIIHRISKKQVQIGDKIIPAQSLIGLAIGAGNRDPEHFESPNDFILNRINSKILSFGFGAHLCIGASLSKQETSIAIQTLFESFPNLKLQEDFEPTYRHSSHVRGFSVFPLSISNRQKDIITFQKDKAISLLQNALKEYGHFPTYEFYPEFELKKHKSWHYTFPSIFIHANVMYSLQQVPQDEVKKIVKDGERFIWQMKEKGDLWRFWNIDNCEHPIPLDIDDTAIASIVLKNLGKLLENKNVLNQNIQPDGEIFTWINSSMRMIFTNPQLYFYIQKNQEKIQATYSYGMFNWNDAELGVKVNLLAYLGENKHTNKAIKRCIEEWKSQSYKLQFYKDSIIVAYHIARAFREGIHSFKILKEDIEKFLEQNVSELNFTESLFAYLILEYFQSETYLQSFLKKQITNQIYLEKLDTIFYEYFTSKDRIYFAGSPCLTAALFLEVSKDW